MRNTISNLKVELSRTCYIEEVKLLRKNASLKQVEIEKGNVIIGLECIPNTFIYMVKNASCLIYVFPLIILTSSLNYVYCQVYV